MVENLRTTEQGWGEIGIRLAVAQELTKVNSATFPTMTESLARVGDLRAEGKGWGAIAKELGFKLGPVVSEANRVSHELRAEAERQRQARRNPIKSFVKVVMMSKADACRNPTVPILCLDRNGQSGPNIQNESSARKNLRSRIDSCAGHVCRNEEERLTDLLVRCWKEQIHALENLHGGLSRDSPAQREQLSQRS